MARKPPKQDGPLAIEYRLLDAIRPAPVNARTHSDAQVAQIAASMRQFGWTNPILVDEDGTIIAGHGRLAAARANDAKEAPVIVLRGLSADQRRALAIADNKLALNAGWSEDVLRAELGELGLAGFDLSLIGFSAEELSILQGRSDVPEGVNPGAGGAGSLAEKFGVPPFSVLNAREGWWQDRKRQWLALGIQSELGRGAPIGGGRQCLWIARGGAMPRPADR